MDTYKEAKKIIARAEKMEKKKKLLNSSIVFGGFRKTTRSS